MPRLPRMPHLAIALFALVVIALPSQVQAFQYALPDSDLYIGFWLPDPLWQELDEWPDPDDGTSYISSSSPPAASDSQKVRLSDVTDPETTSGHKVRFRQKKNTTGGKNINIVWSLYEGSSDKISGPNTILCSGPWTTNTYTLTSTEADRILDYSDLWIAFYAEQTDGPAGNRRALITWIWLEVPDAP